LVNSRDIFLQIQALHCELSEFLLHVGVFAYDLTFFHCICSAFYVTSFGRIKLIHHVRSWKRQI